MSFVHGNGCFVMAAGIVGNTFDLFDVLAEPAVNGIIVAVGGDLIVGSIVDTVELNEGLVWDGVPACAPMIECV